MTPHDEDKTWTPGGFEGEDEPTWLPGSGDIPRPPRPGPAAEPSVGKTFVPFDPTIHVDRPSPPPTPAPGKPASKEPELQRLTPAPEPATPMSSGSAGAPAAGQATVRAERIAGRFEVLSVLGEGGMGKVYRVKDHEIEGRELALKVLLPRFSRDDRFRDLFLQEIRASQKFVSENVIQVRDTGRTPDKRLFLTMDLVEGESLRGLLEREDTLQVRHALEIGRQILLGLQSGHEHGFIHRDVKPSNVMLAARVAKTDDNPFGVGVKLLDFGIAGVVAELAEGKIAGTPMYMSPEQINGDRLDPRSDLFSVGIVLYELLTGKRPFEGTTLQEIQTSVLETNLAPMIAEIADLQRPERKILQRALQKDREKRFASATEFIRAIESCRSYKPAASTATWAGVGLTLLGAATIGEAFVIGKQYVDLGDAQRQAESAQQDVAALADANTQAQARIVDLGGQLDAALSANVVTEVTEDTTSKVEFAKLEEANARLLAQLTDAERERDLVAAERVTLASRAESLERRNQELENQVEKLRRTNEPTKLASAGFDDLLYYFQHDQGRQAAARLTKLQESQTFDVPDYYGSNFIRAMVAATAGMQEHAETGSAQSLDAAETAVLAARAAWPDFLTQSSDWIEETDRSGSVPARAEDALEVLANLEDRVKSERDRAVQAQLAQWGRLRVAPADQDPHSAVELHRETGDDAALLSIADRFVEFSRSELVLDGRLVQDRLADANALEGWLDLFDSRGASLGYVDADFLRNLALARRFYHGDEEAYRSLWHQLPQTPLTQPEPHVSWPDELRLKAAVYSDFDAVPAWQRGRRLFMIRQGGELDGWKLREQVAPAGPDSWTLSQRTFSDRGQPDPKTETLTFEHAERVIQRAGQFKGASIDLGSPAEVALWSPVDVGLAPPLLKNNLDLDPTALENFRRQIEAAPKPVLVRESGKDTLYFSPDLGMVYYKTEYGAEWLLVWAEVN